MGLTPFFYIFNFSDFMGKNTSCMLFVFYKSETTSCVTGQVFCELSHSKMCCSQGLAPLLSEGKMALMWDLITTHCLIFIGCSHNRTSA